MHKEIHLARRAERVRRDALARVVSWTKRVCAMAVPSEFFIHVTQTNGYLQVTYGNMGESPTVVMEEPASEMDHWEQEPDGVQRRKTRFYRSSEEILEFKEMEISSLPWLEELVRLSRSCHDFSVDMCVEKIDIRRTG
jgi:hypothetical protein